MYYLPNNNIKFKKMAKISTYLDRNKNDDNFSVLVPTLNII